MNSVKTLRAGLLRYILQTNFERTFGGDWWNGVLLPHMRSEAMKGATRAGVTYSIALKRFGRAISPENLDTSALSAVILYDEHFQTPPNEVLYSGFELDTARRLHAFRNRTSHEENNTEALDEADRLTLRVLRTAVNELELELNAPELAADILKAYAEVYGLRDLSTDQKHLLKISEKLEEAERAYKWEIEKSIPIYESLAEQGVVEAQKKLLEICTHTVRYFDLDRAVQLCDRYATLADSSIEIRMLRDSFPHLIWGTPSILNLFRSELTEHKLIRSAQLEEYIQKISAEFPGGLLSFLQDDAAIEYLSPSCPNLELAQALLTSRSGQTEKYLRLLLNLAKQKNPSAKDTIAQVKRLAEKGCVPLIEHYAAKAAKELPNDQREEDLSHWISLGLRHGSEYCRRHKDELEKTPATMLPAFTRTEPGAEKSQVEEKQKKDAYDPAVKVDELNAKLIKYKIATGIMGATIALLILHLIFHT